MAPSPLTLCKEVGPANIWGISLLFSCPPPTLGWTTKAAGWLRRLSAIFSAIQRYSPASSGDKLTICNTPLGNTVTLERNKTNKENQSKSSIKQSINCTWTPWLTCFLYDLAGVYIFQVLFYHNMWCDQAKWVLFWALSNFSFVMHLWKHSMSFVLLNTY